MLPELAPPPIFEPCGFAALAGHSNLHLNLPPGSASSPQHPLARRREHTQWGVKWVVSRFRVLQNNERL